MSLTLDVKVILNLWARIIWILYNSTQSHISNSTFGVGTHSQLEKIPHTVPESMYRIGIGLDTLLIPIHVISNCCTDSSGDILTSSRFPTKLRWWLLHVGVSVPTQSWHLLFDPITHLVSDLSRAHQKVGLYGTFVSGLHHLPTQMKNHNGLNEGKTLVGKK